MLKQSIFKISLLLHRLFIFFLMLKKLLSVLFSTRLMAVLFIVFAAAMAAGTFIEDAYNTDAARVWIYNAWWFEAIMLVFVINFFGNIKKYQLYKKEKWATLLLHLSFIFILVGAFITRYISYEGMMPIREHSVSRAIYSDKSFLTLYVDGMYKGKMMRRSFEEPLILSPAVYPPFASNNFSISTKFNQTPFSVSYKDFIADAKETIVEDKNGKLFLKMVESGGGSRHEHYLEEGQIANIHNILFTLNKPVAGAVNIISKLGVTTISTPFDGSYMRMSDKLQGKVTKNTTDLLMFRSLYNVGEAQFVFPEQPIKGSKKLISGGDLKAKQNENALIVTVETEGKTKEVVLKGTKGKQGEGQTFKLGKLEFTLAYGSKIYETPFAIKLNDFIAEKYPGTEKSYSSFKSKITVMDTLYGNNKRFDTDVYMNHVLDYQGFRFFQSSFDPDEQGTILSVNHDSWGTNITYLGYFLLYFGLMAILFVKNTRFADLKRKLNDIKKKKASLLSIAVLLLFSSYAIAQNHNHKINFQDSILKYKVPEIQAEKFGRLIIQDEGGRMKPINTFSSELLRKISKHDNFFGLNSDQAFLSMTQYPNAWFELPVLYIKKGNDSLRGIIGVNKDEKYASLRNFFDEKGNYKLSRYLDEANRASVPNQFQKDFIDIDKRVNLYYRALYGGALKVFPIPNDKNNKWVSYLELSTPTGTALDTIKNALPIYLNALSKGIESKNFTMANTMLDGIDKYQQKFGKSVIPTKEKVDVEILYNKYDVFKNLFAVLMVTSVIMIILVVSNIFFNPKWLILTINATHIFIAILFVVHTLGLIARWYVSGHAPWSNAYESMIYVSWATSFFALAFDTKSKLTVAAGAFVSSMILMIAHWNWMDPDIGNLQPVLNSYWLMIHVAIIVASYGPFTLGMVLGLVSLLLIIFTNKNNKQKMELNIKEITYITEMALTIGLVMLTIGNFLGGQWANESWGRYWGWDPKETWALISIMVYAFVIHARFVPALRGLFAFNFMSVLAFASILMTYFGVNFHLSGMHSYATGERQNVQIYLYILVGYFILSAIAYVKYRKWYKK